ncbi:MAG: hypothetical protein K0U24_09110 [Gammaproteobacteria bacterium]|nr:hypothetical protein [Gammaproteobacteria bacterium]
MKKTALDDSVFYRALKVSYVYIQVIFFIGISCFGWFSLKPHQAIATEKSYISCPDGAKYFFSSLNISNANYELALEICENHLKPAKNLDSSTKPTFPAIHQVNQITGSWVTFVKFEVLSLILAFLLLNGIKQSLLYVIYKKKFTFPFSRDRNHS